MVWSTKYLGRDRDYVVIKHKLRDINGMINGVRFRAGYAVVEKDSKRYRALKKLPLIKGQPEFPLIFLRKLPFITRTADVRMVYGQDVYVHYHRQLIKALEAEKEEKRQEEEKVHVEEGKSCNFRTQSGTLCKNDALECSPSGYCKMHLLEDARLSEFGFTWPTRMSRSEKRDIKNKIVERLSKLKARKVF